MCLLNYGEFEVKGYGCPTAFKGNQPQISHMSSQWPGRGQGH
jgi:hypothetical protein